jgi:hypothetical protein
MQSFHTRFPREFLLWAQCNKEGAILSLTQEHGVLGELLILNQLEAKEADYF